MSIAFKVGKVSSKILNLMRPTNACLNSKCFLHTQPADSLEDSLEDSLKAKAEEDMRLMKFFYTSYGRILNPEVPNLFVDVSCDENDSNPTLGYVLYDKHFEYMEHGCYALDLPDNNNTLWEIGAVPASVLLVSDKIDKVRVLSDSQNAVRFFLEGSGKTPKTPDFNYYNEALADYNELEDKVESIFWIDRSYNRAADAAAHILQGRKNRQESRLKKMVRETKAVVFPSYMRAGFWQ